MVFKKVMLIYGVPEKVMGCGCAYDIISPGEGFCPMGLACRCNMCKYELVHKKDVWIYPCCSKVKSCVRGIKIGSIDRDDLEIAYAQTAQGIRYIDTAHYVSSTGKRFELNEIFQSMVVDSDYKVPKDIIEKWDQIKENSFSVNSSSNNSISNNFSPVNSSSSTSTFTTSKPQVYLMLDDCTSCS